MTALSRILSKWIIKANEARTITMMTFLRLQDSVAPMRVNYCTHPIHHNSRD